MEKQGLASGFAEVTIQRTDIERTLSSMREFGGRGWELLVLWLGDVDPIKKTAKVTRTYVPDQKPISSEDGVGYFVSGEALFKLNRGLSETGLRLIAQVHSHPREAYHSEADDRFAIVTAQGGLSLVVPNFGHTSSQLSDWAIYQLRGREWEELSPHEVDGLFKVI